MAGAVACVFENRVVGHSDVAYTVRSFSNTADNPCFYLVQKGNLNDWFAFCLVPSQIVLLHVQLVLGVVPPPGRTALSRLPQDGDNLAFINDFG
jgi:hypothetical protein